MSDVLISVSGLVGRITLNRPKAINALTLEMVRLIDRALIAWQTDPGVHAVLIDGAGERGLCAGGDIRSLYDGAKAGSREPEIFFREEYLMNDRIAGYPKPVVALMDGIVMGGGIGISAHASHRVVTERSRLAMPEVGIGFFPDVGGTYLLGSQAPGELGTHIALATPSFSADDAIAAALADYFVPSDRLAALTDAVLACPDAGAVETVLSGCAAEPPLGSLRAARSWIDEAYRGDDVEVIVGRLEARPEDAARAAAQEIRGKSPLALKQTLRLLRHARKLAALRPCLESELVAACQFMTVPDFVEGVRAAVIDKDRNPRWSPALLSDVGQEDLVRFFPEARSVTPPLFLAGDGAEPE